MVGQDGWLRWYVGFSRRSSKHWIISKRLKIHKFLNSKQLIWNHAFLAATHCSELPYLFLRGVAAGFYPNDTDMAMYETFSTYFTNFAKYGQVLSLFDFNFSNPNGNDAKEQVWEAVPSNDTNKHFRINHPKSIMDDHIHRGRMEQWFEILNEDEKSKI